MGDCSNYEVDVKLIAEERGKRWIADADQPNDWGDFIPTSLVSAANDTWGDVGPSVGLTGLFFAPKRLDFA